MWALYFCCPLGPGVPTGAMMFVTIDPPDDAVSATRETVVAPSSTSNRMRARLRVTPVECGAGSMSVTCGVGNGTGVHCDVPCGMSLGDGAALLTLHAAAARSKTIATTTALAAEFMCASLAFLAAPVSRLASD
jgi:hypothetical protein